MCQPSVCNQKRRRVSSADMRYPLTRNGACSCTGQCRYAPIPQVSVSACIGLLNVLVLTGKMHNRCQWRMTHRGGGEMLTGWETQGALACEAGADPAPRWRRHVGRATRAYQVASTSTVSAKYDGAQTSGLVGTILRWRGPVLSPPSRSCELYHFL